jgi:hypothetical protein
MGLEYDWGKAVLLSHSHGLVDDLARGRLAEHRVPPLRDLDRRDEVRRGVEVLARLVRRDPRDALARELVSAGGVCGENEPDSSFLSQLNVAWVMGLEYD